MSKETELLPEVILELSESSLTIRIHEDIVKHWYERNILKIDDPNDPLKPEAGDVIAFMIPLDSVRVNDTPLRLSEVNIECQKLTDSITIEFFNRAKLDNQLDGVI